MMWWPAATALLFRRADRTSVSNARPAAGLADVIALLLTKYACCLPLEARSDILWRLVGLRPARLDSCVGWPRMAPAFTWRDGERTIRVGRGTIATFEELLGTGFTLLTTERAEADAPAVVAAAASV